MFDVVPTKYHIRYVIRMLEVVPTTVSRSVWGSISASWSFLGLLGVSLGSLGSCLGSIGGPLGLALKSVIVLV